MRRAEFLQLTGLSVDTLKNFVRRDCVPFAASNDGEATTYDYRQAFATRLVSRLGEFLDLKQARIIVENYLDLFIAEFGKALLEGQQIFFGFGRHQGYVADKAGGQIYLHDAGVIAGPISALTETFDNVETDRIEFVPLGSRKPRLFEVALVDAGRELAEFRRYGGDHTLATQWMKPVEAL